MAQHERQGEQTGGADFLAEARRRELRLRAKGTGTGLRAPILRGRRLHSHDMA